jgi:S1-C subfamily serine protease
MDVGRWLGQSPEHRAELVVTRARERLNLRVQLVPFEQVVKSRLGLTLIEPAGTPAERLGLGRGQGLYVEAVERASPADKAGLRKGHIITGVDSQTARDVRSVGELITRRKPGEPVVLSVIMPRRLGGSYLEVRQGTVEVPLR